MRASQYIAGDRTVLHHTLNSLIPPDAPKDQRIDFGRADPNAARITAYIPGAQPQLEPPNTGGLLKKDSSLALQLHYTTNGKATIDAGEIGLWFYKDDEVPTERMIAGLRLHLHAGLGPDPAVRSRSRDAADDHDPEGRAPVQHAAAHALPR